jgi:hypothetical protein
MRDRFDFFMFGTLFGALLCVIFIGILEDTPKKVKTGKNIVYSDGVYKCKKVYELVDVNEL